MEDNVTTLIQEIPALQLFYDTSGSPPFKWEITPVPTLSSNGWKDVADLGLNVTDHKVWAFQTEIDVSGWGNQGLTFYPLQAGVQEGYMFSYLNDDVLQVIDLISDSPLDLVSFGPNLLSLPDRTVPALYQSVTPNRDLQPLEFNNVLYGQSRVMGYNSNFPTAGGIPLSSPISINDFGSMEPTATDRLYITRILVCDNSSRTSGFMNCPTSRFIIKGSLMRESDLSYVYRLKESFKSAQTDVGVGNI